MKENHFDRIIREKLDQFQAPFLPDSWEQFEQKLDAGEVGVPEPEDQMIDETVFNRIHRLEVPFRSDHWSKMAGRLDREFVRPEEVLRYKTAELSLFTLLLFAIWNWTPTTPVQDTFPQAVHTPAAIGESPAAVDLASASPDEESIVFPDQPGPGLQTSSSSSTPPVNGNLPENGPALTGLAQQPNNEVGNSGLSSFAPLSAIRPGQIHPSSPDLSLTDHLVPTALEVGQPVALSIPAQLNALPPADLRPSNEAAPAFAAPVPARPVRNLYFGMFGSLDYNRIITPADRFLDVETKELDRYELGYSGGFSFAADIGKHWEIQTGLIYSAKKYQPSALIVQSGNFRDGYEIEQLKDIELNIIHIPLNIRYNLFHYDKWRIYVLGGASLQVATLGNYYVEGEGTRRSSVLSKYIENGWFEGGAFRDNSYVTGNLGFGLEHFVTTKWSLFAQPTYQHAINFFEQGLGSTHDRISTMSIYSGIRVRLKQ